MLFVFKEEEEEMEERRKKEKRKMTLSITLLGEKSHGSEGPSQKSLLAIPCVGLSLGVGRQPLGECLCAVGWKWIWCRDWRFELS